MKQPHCANAIVQTSSQNSTDVDQHGSAEISGATPMYGSTTSALGFSISCKTLRFFWPKQTGCLPRTACVLRKLGTGGQRQPDRFPSSSAGFSSTAPRPSGQPGEPFPSEVPSCLSMNWRGDGVAACRSAGSHPPGVSASPLWHARHPLARGPWPAIPSQCSN